jgi:Heparinase II/III-like protein/Heparinase II/III N-terminus
MTSRFGWYARRASRMSPAEVAWRGRDKILQAAWSNRQVSRDQVRPLVRGVAGSRPFAVLLPVDAALGVPEEASNAVLAAANRLLRGHWEMLGVARTDLVAPDWFHDPVTGVRSPAERYAFRINHRSETETGNVKQVWELSRLQHLTLLATAWFLSGDDVYAQRVADHLQSWWQENPFLSGVHWTSGIEVGIRLISLTWIRRLLGAWPGAPSLFEHNDLAVQQIWWHQRYLAAFRSRGSSANNHVIAEAAGQLVASCAFPWFPDSARWRQASARLLERELLRNTFPSGIGRELASDYQSFVAELGILAGVEAGAAHYPLSADAWRRLCAMVDSGAAILDHQLRPPRQGDGDEGRALLLDAPTDNRWPSLLALGAAVFGRPHWWPPTKPDVASSLIAAMPAAAINAADRPAERPWHFQDAGTTLLRTNSNHGPEIWCRCDGGPHGFLKIAAHAHADALSVEVRYGGVDILADPGTYCYHGQREWRSYFRSTIAHNTIEIDGRSQSRDGGPFLWLRHANAKVIDVQDIGDAVEWSAEHDGYLRPHPGAWHRRCVRLDRASRRLDIADEITGGSHEVRMAYHLGPDVVAELDGTRAILQWAHGQASGAALLELPKSLSWRLHKGETNPILGWYSSGLSVRVPVFTLLGRGRSTPGEPFSTQLEFLDISSSSYRSFADPALSWSAAEASGDVGTGKHAEDL